MKYWVKHQLFDGLMLVGLRDRLRCPKCKAVGTYKPHGGWCELFHSFITNVRATLKQGTRYATDRRWLCKFCGYNVTPDGTFQCYPNARTGAWGLKDDDSTLTPQQLIGTKIWPWRG